MKDILFVFLLIIQVAHAKCEKSFHVVSDFDDTLKYYRSHNLVIFLNDVLDKENIYPGMGELMRQLISRAQNCEEVTALTILTASPKWVGDEVRRTLDVNDVPPRDIYFKPTLEKTFTFKNKSLERISFNHKVPLMLFGDNSHEDSQIYELFQKKNPKSVLKTYIHQLYPQSNNHFSYITAFEVALSEYRQGRLSERAALSIGQNILEAKGERIIPNFAYCPINEFIPLSENVFLDEMAQEISRKVIHHCQNR